MIIIGIDPGKTLGLCAYDTLARRVLWSATTQDAGDAVALVEHWHAPDGRPCDAIGIERARIYGMGGAEVANTIEQVGWLLGRLDAGLPRTSAAIEVCCNCPQDVYTVERRAVLSALSQAVGETVRKDAGVWAALLTLHPDGTRKPSAAVEAGPLYGVKAHARAALAVAWTLGKHLDA